MRVADKKLHDIHFTNTPLDAACFHRITNLLPNLLAIRNGPNRYYWIGSIRCLKNDVPEGKDSEKEGLVEFVVSNALLGISATPKRSGIFIHELPDEASSVASVSSVPCVVYHDYPLAVSFPGVSE